MTAQSELTLPDGLSTSARLYVHWIWQAWGFHDKPFFEDQEAVAMRFAVKARTIRNWEQELCDAGVIQRKRRGRQGRQILFTAPLIGGSVTPQPEATFRSNGSLTGSSTSPNRKPDVRLPEPGFRRLQGLQETSIMNWPNDLDPKKTANWDRQLLALADTMPRLRSIDRSILGRGLRQAAIHYLPALEGPGLDDPAKRKTREWCRQDFDPTAPVGAWLETLGQLSKEKGAPEQYLATCLNKGPQGAAGAPS